MKKEEIKKIIADEIARALGQRDQGRRELLGRAAALGLEERARDMLAAGSSEQKVKEWLLDENAKRSRGSGSANSRRRPRYERVEDVPRDELIQMICNPPLYSFDSEGGSRPAEVSRQHDRTGSRKPAYRTVADVSSDELVRAICDPTLYSFRD